MTAKEREDLVPDPQRPCVRVYELHWEDHEPMGDLFPDGLDADDSFYFHGTSSTREEVIDREGLRPHSGGVSAADVRTLVECFDLLGWCGVRVVQCQLLKAYSLNHDFRDGEVSPLFLSDRSSQSLYSAIPSAAGGEKLSACGTAIADLKRFVSDAKFRAEQIRSPDKWMTDEASKRIDRALLTEIDARLSTLGALEHAAQREREQYRYGVIYAIRPPTRRPWMEGNHSTMGYRVFEPIPPTWFVAKLRVYPPPKRLKAETA